MEGIDAPGRLLDLTTNGLGDELLDKLLEVTAGGFTGHDLEHLLANFSDLTGLGIRCLSDLGRTTLCEADCEQTEEVAVGRLYVDVGFDEGLPFTDERAKFVGCEVHAMEICEAVLSLYFVDPELYFAEGLLLVLVEVREREFDDTALERVVGVFWMEKSAT